MKPEQRAMVTIFDWIRLKKLNHICFHIANERRTTPQAGALLKRMGVLSGVSDIFMARQSKGFPGLFIEVKERDKNGKWGVLSENQKRFMKDMGNEGYFVALAKGANEAILIIEYYLS